MTVEEDTAHILFHVEAEAATSDPSQVPGVAGRAQQVRVLLNPFGSDNRTIGRGAWHNELRAQPDNQSPLQQVLDDLEDNSNQRIRLVLQTWIGTNKGPLDG